MSSKLYIFYFTGNYFIMDTEQLVVNPLEVLQKEALDKEKKTSLTEKLTQVKNAVCENHLSLKTDKLKTDITNRLKKVHSNCSDLRYEYKLFDIYKRKNDLENKQRVDPAHDFTYDKKQIKISEKRLGIMTESYYLNKRQPFPLRGRNINDFDSGPTINRARLKMKEQQEYQKEEVQKSRIALSTPGSTSMMSASTRVPIWLRRGSKSAPPSAKPFSGKKRRNPYNDQFVEDDTHLPVIEHHEHQKHKDAHVKFSIQDENEVRLMSPETIPLHTTIRPSTYTGVVASRRRKSMATVSAWGAGSDSEDDEIDIMQKINLRAVIFGSKPPEHESTPVPRPTTRESSRSVPTVMHRGKNKPLTQEMLVKEQEEIDKRLTKFYTLLNNREDGGYSSEEEDLPPPPPPPKITSKFPKVAAPTSKSEAIMNAFAKPVDESLRWKTVDELKREEEAAIMKQKILDKSPSPVVVEVVKEVKVKKKKRWDFIYLFFFNHLTPTDRFSLVQNYEWKSPLQLLSVERVNIFISFSHINFDIIMVSG